ncbi:response regulator [Thalassotalea sp. G2M2-11]|uniref:response regulator n=1 Tax=Thalassotalea sp. G2M2-11 TaxID=2787627 RepID=UPI0019D2D0FC|nr:response regulator [Thalassotalea sp. G2M2-11]
MSSSVLICDDSNLARKQVLRSLPESLSSTAQLATNGEEALELLSQQNFDLLFLDLTMPVVDGIGVLEGIKAAELSVNVFVISADVQPEMQSKVMQLGAKAFLRKPVQKELLHHHLNEYGLL